MPNMPKVPRAKGSLKAGKEQTKKFEGKAKEDGEKLGTLADGSPKWQWTTMQTGVMRCSVGKAHGTGTD